MPDFVKELTALGLPSYVSDNCIAFFLWLNDEALNRIKREPKILRNVNKMRALLTWTGDNMHIFHVKASGIKAIRQTLRAGIRDRKPKSISWVNQDMNKFIYRRIACQ